MEELGVNPKQNIDDDLPLVHGSNKRNESEPTEENSSKEEDVEVEENNEYCRLLDPDQIDYPTDTDRIALKRFLKRVMEFYMNFILLVISIMCAVFHGQWAGPVPKNFITVFPFSVFCGFSGMFVYIILIYRWWHRAHKHWRMLTVLICGITFLAVGIMEVYFLKTHSFNSDGSMHEVEYTSDNKAITKYYKHVSQGTIITVAFLSFTVAALSFIDAFIFIQ